MEKRVQKLTDEDLKGYPIRDLVEGWFFRVDEVSQGFYQVEGIDRWGRKVSRMGIDPDQLLKLCKSDIEEMILSGETIEGLPDQFTEKGLHNLNSGR